MDDSSRGIWARDRNISDWHADHEFGEGYPGKMQCTANQCKCFERGGMGHVYLMSSVRFSGGKIAV